MSAVFWDLDGTLTDPKPGITGSVINTLTDLGLSAPSADDLEWVIGPALLWSFEQLGTPDPQAALEIYRTHYTERGGMYDCAVYPGIPDALRAIGHQHNMYLATAKPHVYARKITDHFGLAQHLTDEFGPELDGTRNDKGDLLRFALERTGKDAARCVMIGDRQYDMAAARHVGMRFIAVTWGYGAADDLSAADAVAKTPGDLPALVHTLLG